MSGRLALVGGDEFRSGCEAMDAAILAATGSANPVVLIVPTAAAFENPARAADNGVRHFESLGAAASPLMVLNHNDAMDAGIAAEVEGADLVYLTGGNPAHLLETLQDSLLLDSIHGRLEHGGDPRGVERRRDGHGELDEVQGVASHTRHRGGHRHTAASRKGRPGYGARRVGISARQSIGRLWNRWTRGRTQRPRRLDRAWRGPSDRLPELAPYSIRGRRLETLRGRAEFQRRLTR